MKTVWKFPVPIQDTFVLNLPTDAEILHIGLQDGKPILWALIDPAAKFTAREFSVFGTGNPIPANPGKHVGTIQMPIPAAGLMRVVGRVIVTRDVEGPSTAVWHIFESR
jgi:hypothetical protein